MTGLPTLLVELDDGTGTFPYDITAYVERNTSWEVNRGRGNEFGDVQPGRLTISLNNRDGRFTLGNPTYGVEVNQRIRLTETVGATTSARHTGYVEDWPQRWTSALANVAVSGITSLDRFERLARRDMPASLLQGEILLDSPVAYYTLGELEGATTAGDTSGNGVSALTQSGTGTAAVFGQAAGPAYDELTAVTFAGGKILTGQFKSTDPVKTVECFFLRNGTPPFTEFILNLIGVARLRDDVFATGAVEALVGGIVLTSDPGLFDGAVHHLAVTFDAGTSAWSLYVDGVLADGPTVGTAPSAPTTLYVGGNQDAAGVLHVLNGVVAHVALYDTTVSAARVAAHASAGLSPEADSSDERLARLAGYAAVPTAEQDLELGALTEVAHQSGGGKVLPAMQSVTRAEGGVLHTAGDGTLTLQARTHRVLTATGTPVLELEVAEVDHEDLVIGGARDYMVNAVTGSRENGAVQRVVDEDSREFHDEYPEDMSGLLVLTDAQVLDAITWRKTAYSTPRPRLATVTIDLFTSPSALQEAVLAVELGGRITISGWPTQAPWATADLLVEGLRERQSLSEWKVTFNTVPAELFHAWVLGDATHGVLGSTTRLHY
jgi:hypothetical protein